MRTGSTRTVIRQTEPKHQKMKEREKIKMSFVERIIDEIRDRIEIDERLIIASENYDEADEYIDSALNELEKATECLRLMIESFEIIASDERVSNVLISKSIDTLEEVINDLDVVLEDLEDSACTLFAGDIVENFVDACICLDISERGKERAE